MRHRRDLLPAGGEAPGSDLRQVRTPLPVLSIGAPAPGALLSLIEPGGCAPSRTPVRTTPRWRPPTISSSWTSRGQSGAGHTTERPGGRGWDVRSTKGRNRGRRGQRVRRSGDKETVRREGNRNATKGDPEPSPHPCPHLDFRLFAQHLQLLHARVHALDAFVLLDVLHVSLRQARGVLTAPDRDGLLHPRPPQIRLSGGRRGERVMGCGRLLIGQVRCHCLTSASASASPAGRCPPPCRGAAR